MSVTTLLSMPLAEACSPRRSPRAGPARTRSPGCGPKSGRLSGRGAQYRARTGGTQSRPPAGVHPGRLGLVVELQTTPDPAKWGPWRSACCRSLPLWTGRPPAAPLTAFADGQGSGVPLLTGSNRDEARLFLVAASTIDLIDDTALDMVAGAYGLPADGLALYRANRPGASPGDILAAVITDWFFRVRPSGSPRPARPGEPTTPGCTVSTTPHRRITRGSGLSRGGDPVRVRQRGPGGDAPPHRRHTVPGRRGPGAPGLVTSSRGQSRLGRLRHRPPHHGPARRAPHRGRRPAGDERARWDGIR